MQKTRGWPVIVQSRLRVWRISLPTYFLLTLNSVSILLPYLIVSLDLPQVLNHQ